MRLNMSSNVQKEQTCLKPEFMEAFRCSYLFIAIRLLFET